MNDRNQKAFGGLLSLLISMAVLLFLPAWTIDYWQAWVFLAVFFAGTAVITVYLMRNDPELLERRINAGSGAEKEKKQKTIQFAAQIAFIAVIVFPAIDHRFAWSTMPPYVSIAGDVLVALGFIIIFLVFKENSFASAIIEVSTEQKVISTGPYGLIRHPMYSGALVMLSGIPIALGSWWGLLLVIPMAGVIIARLLDEETFLARNLSGYTEYCQAVPYRLIPRIW